MQRVLPFYLAVDTSTSMYVSGRLDAVQETVVRFTEELLSNPLLGEHIRLGLVTFSDQAELVLPLTDLTELRSLPRLSGHGAAHYGVLFRYLGRVIERDLRVLRAHDTVTFRPFVFLLTAGMPSDSGWEQAFHEFDELTRAQLVVMGVGMEELPPEVLRRLNPVDAEAWSDVPADVLAARITSVLERYAMSLIASTMVSINRDSDPPRMPPPNPPLNETDIR
ncbi:vWA domain-containing protein [Streptomyces sp. NBC_00271]|uniref:vWA domain-containing protein n=1 Tax=Streptomyces sp. NBC_00271 TaxID=2975697 RepID=UPI002E2E435C|nr:VWA domain-containing protein [Streptomyces sp. NBC_00271]